MVCTTYSWCNYFAKEIFGILSAFFPPPKRLLALFPQGATGLRAGRPRTQNVPRRTNHLWIYRTRRLWFQRSTRSWCWRSSASSRPTRPPWKTREKQVCISAGPVIQWSPPWRFYLSIYLFWIFCKTLDLCLPLPHTHKETGRISSPGCNSFVGADESRPARCDFWPSLGFSHSFVVAASMVSTVPPFIPASLFVLTCKPFYSSLKRSLMNGYFHRWQYFLFLIHRFQRPSVWNAWFQLISRAYVLFDSQIAFIFCVWS